MDPIILLGSRAARARFADARPPQDWDAVASVQAVLRWSRAHAPLIASLVPRASNKLSASLRENKGRIEFEIVEPGTSAALLAAMAPQFLECKFPGGTACAPPASVLWLTKRSHVYWPIHWQKTIADLHWLRDRSGGGQAPPPTSAEWAYHDLRLAEHRARYAERSVKLAMSNESFFSQSAHAVRRAMPHDGLHLLVAYGERPMFEAFKTDLSQAMLSRALFEAAPLQDQLRLVREEAMVIALERFLIPNGLKHRSAATAYARALERICTTLTGGWFRDFAIDHWPAVKTPDKDFLTPVRAALGVD